MTNIYDDLANAPSALDTPSRVLTIGAHPDDAEFGAGATLARWARDGTDITIVTDGSKGSWNADENQAELVKRRQREQHAAAAIIGASTVLFLDEVDGELEYSTALRLRLATIIRDVRPDVVMSHDPWQRYQLHPDHRATGLASVDAVVSAREPLAMVDSGLAAHRPVAILLWSADQPDHLEPAEPDFFDLKVQALLCHSRQSETTMGDAASDVGARDAFIDKLSQRHVDNGSRFGSGPAEIFKRLTP